jgi:hypothetical protein
VLEVLKSFFSSRLGGKLKLSAKVGTTTKQQHQLDTELVKKELVEGQKYA